MAPPPRALGGCKFSAGRREPPWQIGLGTRQCERTAHCLLAERGSLSGPCLLRRAHMGWEKYVPRCRERPKRKNESGPARLAPIRRRQRSRSRLARHSLSSAVSTRPPSLQTPPVTHDAPVSTLIAPSSAEGGTIGELGRRGHRKRCKAKRGAPTSSSLTVLNFGTDGLLGRPWLREAEPHLFWLRRSESSYRLVVWPPSNLRASENFYVRYLSHKLLKASGTWCCSLCLPQVCTFARHGVQRGPFRVTMPYGCVSSCMVLGHDSTCRGNNTAARSKGKDAIFRSQKVQ
jgi:hypothetical protein